MASRRVNDFAIKGFGGHGEGNVHESGVFDIIDKPKYDAAVARFGASRTLTCISASAGDNIDADVDAAVAIIKKKTNGDLGTIGAFCAIGASNSCALVLALAAKLKRLGAPQLGYLGLVDLPMFPFGRNPTLQDLGPMRPINRPVNAAAVPQHPTTLILPPPRYPRTLELTPPVMNFSGLIDADTKRNFYQTEGNGWKIVRRTPPPFEELFGRWWTSTMAGNEVHGELIGWGNFRARGIGLTDDDKHRNFCSRDDTWGRAESDLAKALTIFPT